MHALVQHLRYTLRLFHKCPGFTITAVLVFAFGIGVNTAIFSLLDAAVLKPLPFPDPDRLVEVCTPYQKEWLHWMDYPDYLDMAVAQHSFESLAAVTGPVALDLGGTKETQQVRVFFVSPDLAKVTGLPIRLGRWFKEQEDIPHGPLVAVLTEPFWRSQFHSDPNIVGKNVTLSGWSFQIVGVAPMQPWPSWHAWPCGLPVAQVYVPTNVIQTAMKWTLWDRSNHMIDCLGRLKKGVTIAQAQAELEAIHNNLIARYPDQDAGYGLRLGPGGADSGQPAYLAANDSDTLETLLLRTKSDPMALVPELRKIIASIDPDVAIGTMCTYDEMVGDNFSSQKLSVLMVSVFSGAALFLSAIGLYGILAYSVNQRTREIGIRIALGASSANILRLVIQRGIMMVGIGLMIGILTALVCSRSIESLLYEVRGDDPVTLSVVVLVLSLAGLIACLLPARRAAKVDPIAALRQ